MSTETVQLLFFVCFAGLYGGLAIGGISLAQRRRKTKWPFKESDRLLRAPGESLKRRIAAFDERFITEFFGFIMLFLLAWPMLGLLMKAFGLSGARALIPIVICLLVLTAVGAARVMKLWRDRSNYFLGWFGERMAAEKLRGLSVQGYHIFHDVPAEPGKNGFNIDHVTVGPTGVAIVEVKTRRKGNARAGSADHEVVFDGKQLIWPWGEDREPLTQAVNEAGWLEKWIIDRTGLKVAVKPVLTFPGWFVREAPNRVVRVVNTKFLPDAIRGHGEQVLTPKEIDLIARQLDVICRDVED